MGLPVDEFGRQISVQVKLRLARTFMTFTGGDENALVIDGSRMFNDKLSHYHVTVATKYIDVFGTEQFHKRDIHFIIVQVVYPWVTREHTLVFSDDSISDVMLSD